MIQRTGGPAGKAPAGFKGPAAPKGAGLRKAPGMASGVGGVTGGGGTGAVRRPVTAGTGASAGAARKPVGGVATAPVRKPVAGMPTSAVRKQVSGVASGPVRRPVSGLGAGSAGSGVVRRPATGQVTGWPAHGKKIAALQSGKAVVGGAGVAGRTVRYAHRRPGVSGRTVRYTHRAAPAGVGRAVRHPGAGRPGTIRNTQAGAGVPVQANYVYSGVGVPVDYVYGGPLGAGAPPVGTAPGMGYPAGGVTGFQRGTSMPGTQPGSSVPGSRSGTSMPGLRPGVSMPGSTATCGNAPVPVPGTVMTTGNGADPSTGMSAGTSAAPTTGGRACHSCGTSARGCTTLSRFAFNSAELKNSHKAQLRQLAEQILTQNSNAVIATGHADSSGTEDYNELLGEKRAAGVVKELKKQLAALKPGSEKQLFWRIGSKGETNPVSQTNPAANRRVTICVRKGSFSR